MIARTLSAVILGGLIAAALLLWPARALADGPPICSIPQIAIPDADNPPPPGLVTDTITIAGAGTINDLNVSISATHTWVGDLVFTLSHAETGASATLIDRPGVPAGTFGCFQDDIDATLDDEASAPVEDECALSGVAISGVFTPNNPLSVFDGQQLAGTWVLTAADHAEVSIGTLNQWCLIPTPQADLEIDKTVNTTLPNENDLISYTVTVNNIGPDEATGVVVSDTLPISVTFDSASPSQGSYDSGTGLWNIGPLPVGAPAALVINAAVQPGTAGQTVTNTAVISASDQYDPFIFNNADQAAFTVVLADLTVSKSVNESEPEENEIIVYTISLDNNGPNEATGVVISDTLPLSLTLVMSTTSQGSYDDSTGLWDVGSLPDGETATLVLMAMVQPDTAGQTMTNTAEIIASDQVDEAGDNNADDAVITVSNADLAVSKSVDNPTPNEDDLIRFTITVSNNGPDSATGIVIGDLLPDGLIFDSASASQGAYGPGVGLWNPAKLRPGRTATLTLTATVAAGTAGQTITNTAEVTATEQSDSDSTNNMAQAAITVIDADLAVSKIADTANPIENGLLIYTVTVSNTDEMNEATGVVISDTLPLSVTLVASDTSQGSYDSGTGLWQVGSLLPTGSATLTLTTTVQAGTAGQTITNTAQVQAADQGDSDETNNSASVAVVVALVDLAVSKTANTAQPNENETLIYTITATNNGPHNATGVVISDTLPLSVTLVASDTSQGSYDSGTGLWQVGSLLATESATLTLTTTVQAGTAGQTITNTAELDGVDQTDLTPGNDSADVSATVIDADLAVSKAANAALLNENETLVYTVTVTNNSPMNDATGVVISDTLPLSVTLVASDTSQGSYDSGTGLWQVGSLLATESATLTLTTTVQAGTAGQTITNTARIQAADQGDSNETNNSASVFVTIIDADLAVSKAANAALLNENETLVYTVTVTNNSPMNDATGVVISDTLPLSLTLVTSSTSQGSYDSGTGLWQVGSLLATESATLTLTTTVQAGTAGQTITNTARVQAADQGDSEETNNSASVAVMVADANLSISKIAVPDPGVVGAVLTYTVTITNNGPAPAAGVVMSDTLPAAVNFVSVSPGLPTCAELGGVISCTLGALNNGAVVTVTIVVSPTLAGVVTNTARVESLLPDPFPQDNTAVVETTISAPAAEQERTYLPILLKEE